MELKIPNHQWIPEQEIRRHLLLGDCPVCTAQLWVAMACGKVNCFPLVILRKVKKKEASYGRRRRKTGRQEGTTNKRLRYDENSPPGLTALGKC